MKRFQTSVRVDYRLHLAEGMREYLPAPLLAFLTGLLACVGRLGCWCLWPS
jgi:hypothetical protein